jgi:hypothetical protein
VCGSERTTFTSVPRGKLYRRSGEEAHNTRAFSSEREYAQPLGGRLIRHATARRSLLVCGRKMHRITPGRFDAPASESIPRNRFGPLRLRIVLSLFNTLRELEACNPSFVTHIEGDARTTDAAGDAL